jgi:hypothetical protein
MNQNTASANIATQQQSHRATRRDMLVAGGMALVAFAGAASGQTLNPQCPPR